MEGIAGMRMLAVVFIAAIAAPLAAQTTTTCQQFGAIVQCDSQPQPNASANGPDWNAFNAEQSRQSAQRQSVFAQILAQRRQQQADRENAIAGMIQAGRCEDAKRTAAFYGDKRLIQRVLAACP